MATNPPDVQIAGSGRQRPERVNSHREGLYLGGSIPAGASFSLRGMEPTLGFRVDVGGAVTPRVSVGASLGISGYQGRGNTGGLAELNATFFPIAPLYIKLGAGTTLITPAFPLDDSPWRASLMGTGGLGWEFFATRRLAIRIGPHYQAHVRVDARITHTALLSVGLRRYKVGFN